MQDNYVGDIGDYGKYGLLREVCSKGIPLAVNWYRTASKEGETDGKFTSYLSQPQFYREYDPSLFDRLHKIVVLERNRRLERIEQEALFPATYFSEIAGTDRVAWHKRALEHTKAASVVFLDPDNGLETAKMHHNNTATGKHVKWAELKDYYARGQTVILYQHRSRGDSKADCVQHIFDFQKNYLLAEHLKVLEFPKYTNRFYFIFIHKKENAIFEQTCHSMAQKWGKNDFCRELF